MAAIRIFSKIESGVGRGILSNRQALDLFRTHRPPFMSHVLLSHLSQQNNSPQITEDLFTPHRADTEVMCCVPRFKETPVYTISATN